MEFTDCRDLWLSVPHNKRNTLHTYIHTYIRTYVRTYVHTYIHTYEGRTESYEQLFFFFACELGTADEGECGDRWNQLLCYP